ncbi:MAG: DotU family type IV/VI secretion system protein [Fibromonadaceae bacterium]|jgi:type IV/VI secretion system ImpK/VasF family protein|nr:DotU family type IV/VI secretion system protein [Fibromonadaceae bacterium]
MQKSFVEMAENVFCSVLLLPCDKEFSAEETQSDLIEKIKEFCNECANNGYTAGEIENAKYALCAWIDEYIYTNTVIFSQWFSYSLILSEFEDAEAGKRFFEKIENLHKSKKSSALLELYTKCILFGFMGKFRMGETAELKQILKNAISKTEMSPEQVNYKPATKNKHIFSFRRGTKNILITGLSENKCKEAVKKLEPPRGYKYIYSDMKNIEELPYIDGVITINPLQAESDSVDSQSETMQKLFSKQKCKAPVYAVADLEIQEFTQTIDKYYEFNSNHLNYYLHKHFLDAAACKNILSLPRKLEQFKETEAFYSLPFFPFMKNEKPLAYSLGKRAFIISLITMLVAAILFIVFSFINQHKEEIKAEALYRLQKSRLDSIKAAEDSINARNKAMEDSIKASIKAREDSIKAAKDSIKLVEDSLGLEFEKYVRNLELQYQKQILGKLPFKEGKIPTVKEVSEYFKEESEFYKFLDLIDTISDKRIKLDKKALAALAVLKNNTWSSIPVSIVVRAPRQASVKFGIDSQYVEIEQGKSRTIETFFPGKSKNGIEVEVKTANNTFKESISGEWPLLKVQGKHMFSFVDKSYLVDVELTVNWHLPENTVKPSNWFKLRLEPKLIENFSLPNNL